MRVHETVDYAYDLEQKVDPLTQVRNGWRYKVVRLRPVEETLATGEAESREQAEKQARRKIGNLVQKNRRAA